MTEAPLRKREREPEVLSDSIDVRERKCFHSEETDRFLYLLQLDQALADDEEEEFAPSEELVNRVMKSLEEEITETSSPSYPSANSCDNSGASDISRARDSNSGFDLCYLLEASDEELGIPPSPVLDIKEEVCQSAKETSESSREKPDLKSLGEKLHLEDDIEDYEQFALYDNAWDAIQFEDCMNRDFVSQAM